MWHRIVWAYDLYLFGSTNRLFQTAQWCLIPQKEGAIVHGLSKYSQGNWWFKVQEIQQVWVVHLFSEWFTAQVLCNFSRIQKPFGHETEWKNCIFLTKEDKCSMFGNIAYRPDFKTCLGSCWGEMGWVFLMSQTMV